MTPKEKALQIFGEMETKMKLQFPQINHNDYKLTKMMCDQLINAISEKCNSEHWELVKKELELIKAKSYQNAPN